jgi:hypothetical protein
MGQIITNDGTPYTKAQGKAWRDAVLVCACGHAQAILVWDDINADSTADDINYCAALDKLRNANQEHLKHENCFIGLGEIQ